MRIIGGTHRGRRIAAPKGGHTRPTGDRVREALFNLVGPVDGTSVLDLYAGSGALGLEALSRGAASCLFVEQDKPAIDSLKANIAKLGAKGADVRPTSVMALGAALKPLDLILMDPPYGTSAGSVALDKLARLGWTGPATLVSIETAKEETPEVAGFAVEATRTYGKARITLLRAE